MSFARRVCDFAAKYSILWGVLIALVWANANQAGYNHAMHYTLFSVGRHDINPHAVVNELLMAIFFLIAAKEVRGALLPGGQLHGSRHASLPLLAVIGGVTVPALLFLRLSDQFMPQAMHGWVVPTATDIAFALAVASAIYGSSKHPAVTLLITVAILDDAIGLALIPLVYASGVNWLLLLGVVALSVVLPFAMRKMGVRSFWWYLVAVGVPTWIAFFLIGVEPAMALVPMVWGMPHAQTDLGYFDPREEERLNALDEMYHTLKPLVVPILFLFGLANAGISLGSTGTLTWMVLTALVVGKLVGISLFVFAGVACGLRLPSGMKMRDVFVMSAVAGIGFTVSLFVAEVAYSGDMQTEAKMGAFLSLPVAAMAAFILGRVLRIRRGVAA